MNSMEKITTLFDPAEDRVRLSGTTGQDQVMSLWLTQRLINRLAPHLCQALEKQASPSPKAIEPVRAHLEQSFAQQRARVALPKQAPVVPSASSPQWRVDKLDVQESKVGVTLTFKGVADSDRVILNLSTPALRQWLGILFGQCVRAGWSVQAWPAWMVESDGSKQTASSVVLH
jgi:hypothetical protein